MPNPTLSPKFLAFLDDYARRVGKDSGRIIEEAVSQAILRHESATSPTHHEALLMPGDVQRRLATLAGFDGLPTDSTFGDVLEHLPDQKWSYQVARVDDWWFLLITKEPQPLPEPLDLKSLETNQAYVWLFGYGKKIRLWSALDRFLVVF